MPDLPRKKLTGMDRIHRMKREIEISRSFFRLLSCPSLFDSALNISPAGFY
jgi:hypothetical protein